VNADHSWSVLPGNVWWFAPEFLCSAWGLGVFTSAFLIEEVESGLRSVPDGQREAALAQGFLHGGFFVTSFCHKGLRTPGSPSLGSISI
jgi:polar amino acid transport system permease protein